MSKTMRFTMFAATLTLSAAFGYVALAAEGDTPEIASIDVRVEGENYCVACKLHKAGANSSCSVDGHKHAFMITEARDDEGNELPKLKGETLHYIYNTKGKEYTDSHHGETLQISGKLFVDQHVIDIAEVKPAKKKKEEGSAKK